MSCLKENLLQKIVYLVIAVFAIGNLSAQSFSPWPGKKCAVVLTYDDALNTHLDHVIPLLDSLDMKATFYLTAYSPACSKRIADWRKAAAKGYELGNHTLFHPCIGGTGREWVSKDYDMNNYSVRRMVDETRMTNIFLEAIDGKTKRTFAYTCGDMKIGDSSFMNGMKNDFVAARAVRHEMHRINEVDLYNTDCYAMNGESGDQMIELVKKAMSTNSLLVFLFHGVGGEHAINVSLEAHSQLLHFLKDNQKDIWVAPMLEVAEYIKDWQHRDSVRIATQKATEADYAKMLQLLHITSTRKGPSGNPQAPDAANTDESKANPYSSIPDPLILKNGKKVTTTDMWWKKRRAEIEEDFDKEVYGRVPKNVPKVTWQIITSTDTIIGGIHAITKKLVGHTDNSSYLQGKADIDLSLTIPADSKTPVPVVMEFSFVFPPWFRFPDPPPGTPVVKSWQEQVLSKGWGYAIIIPTSFQADNGAGLTEGIIGLVNKGQPRKADDWGALRAWAWGASRAIDYFETDKSVDAKKIAIEGLSRYGKAAVVAMAYDSRIAIGFIGSSGAGGTKILRRVFGEQVENLAGSGEYHWFAGNFIKYAGPKTPNDLPVDAHELLALCAPRPVFISVGSPTVEGQWVDARGMFLTGVNAGPVYKLLGKKDLGTTEFPPMENGLIEGDIAFRQHSGGHTTGPNWPYFLEWASRYFK
ncbi:MAG: polysaccharide deacetylase family protein [Chitinophagaceae bacterium]